MGFSVMRDVNHHFLKGFFKYIYSFLDELLFIANVAAQMGYKYNILDQGSPSSVLEGRCPAEFSSNPNQTHLKQLIKVL